MGTLKFFSGKNTKQELEKKEERQQRAFTNFEAFLHSSSAQFLFLWDWTYMSSNIFLVLKTRSSCFPYQAPCFLTLKVINSSCTICLNHIWAESNLDTGIQHTDTSGRRRKNCITTKHLNGKEYHMFECLERKKIK